MRHDVRALWWIPWFVLVVAWCHIHLGLVEHGGRPYRRFLVPNALTLLRFLLSPLIVLDPVIAIPLALTDLLDGVLARRLGQTSRFGRFLDPQADVAFMVSLVTALFVRDLIPLPLYVLTLLRWPGTLLLAIPLYIVRGPAELRPGLAPRVLLAVIMALLIALAFLEARWAVTALYVLVPGSVLYVVYRGLSWRKSLPGPS
ncbi:MAG: CDP-alcohol phosphatidyltransferase family protein [Deltaproteobacteria bacterium]|nr:CDP-alcohol phosphatidyltransferase family protein [Deltaproteobacteria bacterium]